MVHNIFNFFILFYYSFSSVLSPSSFSLCSLDSSGNPPHVSCKLSPSSNVFLPRSYQNETTIGNGSYYHCTIQFSLSDAIFDFDEQHDNPSFSILTTSEKAAAYSIRSSFSADSGIHYSSEDKETGLSKREIVAVAKENDIFKGPNITRFTYNVMGSSFTDDSRFMRKRDNGTGLYIVSATSYIGSTAQNDAFYSLYGLSARMEITPDVNAIKTTRMPRQQFSSFISNIMSTFFGFTGLFGGILVALETLQGINLPCAMSLKNRIFGQLSDSEEEMEEDVLHQRREIYDPVNF